MTSFAPSGVYLSSLNFNPNIDAGSTITIISSNPGEHDTHRYYLDNSFGDNTLFDTVDNQLTVRETPGSKFETKDSYTIIIGVGGGHNRQHEEEFSLKVGDTNKPDYNIINSVVGKGKLRGKKKQVNSLLPNLNRSANRMLTKSLDLTLVKVTRLEYLPRHSFHCWELMRLALPL